MAGPGGRGRRAPSSSAAAAGASARSLALPHTRRPGAHPGAHAGTQRTRGHPRPPPPPPPRAGAGPSRRRANQHRGGGGGGGHGAAPLTPARGPHRRTCARSHSPARTFGGAARAPRPTSTRGLGGDARAEPRSGRPPRHRDTQTHRGSPRVDTHAEARHPPAHSRLHAWPRHTRSKCLAR